MLMDRSLRLLSSDWISRILWLLVPLLLILHFLAPAAWQGVLMGVGVVVLVAIPLRAIYLLRVAKRNEQEKTQLNSKRRKCLDRIEGVLNLLLWIVLFGVVVYCAFFR